MHPLESARCITVPAHFFCYAFCGAATFGAHKGPTLSLHSEEVIVMIKLCRYALLPHC